MSYDHAACDRTLAALKFPSVGEGLGFSYSSCDACGSKLGGDRHELLNIDDDGETVADSICIDCVMYISYGELPED